jgi:integrase
MRTLTEHDMFRILDHECRDRHLWTLALYALRRGEIAGLLWTNVDLKTRCPCPPRWSTCCAPPVSASPRRGWHTAAVRIGRIRRER